jgi:hypothetical protein
MAVDAVEDVAEEEVGVVGKVGRASGRAAELDGAFQGGKEGELALGSGLHDGAEVGQV